MATKLRELKLSDYVIESPDGRVYCAMLIPFGACFGDGYNLASEMLATTGERVRKVLEHGKHFIEELLKEPNRYVCPKATYAKLFHVPRGVDCYCSSCTHYQNFQRRLNENLMLVIHQKGWIVKKET